MLQNQILIADGTPHLLETGVLCIPDYLDLLVFLIHLAPPSEGVEYSHASSHPVYAVLGVKPGACAC